MNEYFLKSNAFFFILPKGIRQLSGLANLTGQDPALPSCGALGNSSLAKWIKKSSGKTNLGPKNAASRSWKCWAERRTIATQHNQRPSEERTRTPNRTLSPNSHPRLRVTFSPGACPDADNLMGHSEALADRGGVVGESDIAKLKERLGQCYDGYGK